MHASFSDIFGAWVGGSIGKVNTCCSHNAKAVVSSQRPLGSMVMYSGSAGAVQFIKAAGRVGRVEGGGHSDIHSGGTAVTRRGRGKERGVGKLFLVDCGAVGTVIKSDVRVA